MRLGTPHRIAVATLFQKCFKNNELTEDILLTKTKFGIFCPKLYSNESEFLKCKEKASALLKSTYSKSLAVLIDQKTKSILITRIRKANTAGLDDTFLVLYPETKVFKAADQF